jgi:hypothetical protein
VQPPTEADGHAAVVGIDERGANPFYLIGIPSLNVGDL